MNVLPCSAAFLCRRPLTPLKPDRPATMLRWLTSSAKAAAAAASAFSALCFARHLQGDVEGRIGQRERERRTKITGLAVSAHHRRLPDAEVDHATLRIGLAPQPGVRVVGVEHGNAGIRQTVEDFTLGARDIFDRAEKTDVRATTHC